MKPILIKFYEQIRRRYLFLLRRFWAPRIPLNKDGKVYVNVGCGLSSSSEFINVDVLPLPNIHYINEIEDLAMFPDNSVDLIYASHVIEHIPRERLVKTLKEWRRALKRGGILRFSVPSFDQLIKIYHGNGDDVSVVQNQVLGQKPPYDNHYTLWNMKSAEKLLQESGFGEIRVWSPETVDHHDFLDRSSRSIVAGDEDIQLSLNLETVKL